MNVNTCFFKSLFQKCLKTSHKIQLKKMHDRSVIGNRDWVCFGRSGQPSYKDDPSMPFPAIRFRENTNELLALREKEKGDWRKLSLEEKKTLYRASFRQTFSEFLAPTGQWKSIIGSSLLFISFGVWTFILEKLFFYHPKPKTFSDEYRRAVLRRQIDFKMGHLTGVSSHWDYEKDDWKK